ncbi:MAG: hypothetical protein H0V94_01290 [Actinobacteria bacterium]|nr:hypothetical protein [Actinomycetota bacterium]
MAVRGLRGARLRRAARGRPGFVALSLALGLAAALLATWPAVRDLGDGYLARPSAGFGETAAGDHLQLGWALWLPGHQLANAGAPWLDPYSFQPEADRAINLQGWLFGLGYWPLHALLGAVSAYNVFLLLTFVAAGALTTWWLRELGLPRGAALVGGLAFALAPYRVAQSTGHLLGPISLLLPLCLLLVERRRLAAAALALAAIPLSGQTHLALGAIPLVVAYAWIREPRKRLLLGLRRAALLALPAAGAGFAVQQLVIEGSIADGGRSLSSVDRYSASGSDLVDRTLDAGVERFVFLGWLLPLLALAGLALLWRRRRSLALVLGLAALVPIVLALGTTTPLYAPLWHVFPPLHYPRVPERLMPIACLALAALAAFAASRIRRAPLVAVVLVALAFDLRVPVFAAVDADEGNRAYAAMRTDGRLFELPVFRPDTHYGSVYLSYAMQSPRERPQGYSTVGPTEADGLARRLRPLSCGRGEISPAISFVAIHRGLYGQSGYFGPDCADRAEANLVRTGWRLLERDGAVAVYGR